MKKIISIAIILMLIFSFTSCSEETSTKTNRKSKITDEVNDVDGTVTDDVTTADVEDSTDEGLITDDVLCVVQQNPWFEYYMSVSPSYGNEDDPYIRKISFGYSFNDFDGNADTEPTVEHMYNICLDATYSNGAYYFDGYCEGGIDSCEGSAKGNLRVDNGTYILYLEEFKSDYDFYYTDIYSYPLTINFEEGTKKSDNYAYNLNKNGYESYWNNETQSNDEWNEPAYYEITIKKLDSKYIVFDFSQIRLYGVYNIIGHKQSDGTYKFYGDQYNGTNVNIGGNIEVSDDKLVLNIDYVYYPDTDTYDDSWPEHRSAVFYEY